MRRPYLLDSQALSSLIYWRKVCYPASNTSWKLVWTSWKLIITIAQIWNEWWDNGFPSPRRAVITRYFSVSKTLKQKLATRAMMIASEILLSGTIKRKLLMGNISCSLYHREDMGGNSVWNCHCQHKVAKTEPWIYNSYCGHESLTSMTWTKERYNLSIVFYSSYTQWSALTPMWTLCLVAVLLLLQVMSQPACLFLHWRDTEWHCMNQVR